MQEKKSNKFRFISGQKIDETCTGPWIHNVTGSNERSIVNSVLSIIKNYKLAGLEIASIETSSTIFEIISSSISWNKIDSESGMLHNIKIHLDKNLAMSEIICRKES